MLSGDPRGLEEYIKPFGLNEQTHQTARSYDKIRNLDRSYLKTSARSVRISEKMTAIESERINQDTMRGLTQHFVERL